MAGLHAPGLYYSVHTAFLDVKTNHGFDFHAPFRYRKDAVPHQISANLCMFTDKDAANKAKKEEQKILIEVVVLI
jgi:hypothetical protein